MGSKKNIPEGWLSYSPLGKKIPGTVIICFKVPLKEELSQSLLESQKFTPSMLMSKVPNLAGVIDVTNTPRYYDHQVFLEKGILHEKIQCPGHAVPPAVVVNNFQKVMEKMWTTAVSARDKLIGVHCTHGINRTGYLVCRYLIECHGFQPEDAIRLFAESRGHGIERQKYLSDLRTLTPAFCSPNSIPCAEFLRMEQQRRSYWNTDAPNYSARPRSDIPRNRYDHRVNQQPTMPSSVAHDMVNPRFPLTPTLLSLPLHGARPQVLRHGQHHSANPQWCHHLPPTPSLSRGDMQHHHWQHYPTMGEPLPRRRAYGVQHHYININRRWSPL